MPMKQLRKNASDFVLSRDVNKIKEIQCFFAKKTVKNIKKRKFFLSLAESVLKYQQILSHMRGAVRTIDLLKGITTFLFSHAFVKYFKAVRTIDLLKGITTNSALVMNFPSSFLGENH